MRVPVLAVSVVLLSTRVQSVRAGGLSALPTLLVGAKCDLATSSSRLVLREMPQYDIPEIEVVRRGWLWLWLCGSTCS